MGGLTTSCSITVRTRSYLDTLRLQKRGASQTASSGLETRLSRHLPDSDLREAGGWTPTFYGPLPIVSGRRHWIYTLLFFSHSLSPSSPWFGNWLWTVNLAGGFLEGFIAFTGCQDAAHRDGHNHQQVGQDHWQCECHPGSLFLVYRTLCELRVESCRRQSRGRECESNGARSAAVQPRRQTHTPVPNNKRPSPPSRPGV